MSTRHHECQSSGAAPGIAYNIKPTNTVLRASYARTLETPFNENLVLASKGCNDPVVNALMSAAQGYPCLTTPLNPGWRNEFHVGLQQAFGRYLVIDGEYIWKYTHRLTISAFWATRRSRFRSSGTIPRSPATRFAPACRTSTA